MNMIPFTDVKSLICDERTSGGDGRSWLGLVISSVGDNRSWTGAGRSLVGDGRFSGGFGRFLARVSKLLIVLKISSVKSCESCFSVTKSLGDEGRSSGDSKSEGVRSLSGERSTLDSGSWSRRSRSIDCLTFCDEVLELFAPCNVADEATEWTDKSGGNTDTDNEEGDENIKEFEQRLPLLLNKM